MWGKSLFARFNTRHALLLHTRDRYIPGSRLARFTPRQAHASPSDSNAFLRLRGTASGAVGVSVVVPAPSGLAPPPSALPPAAFQGSMGGSASSTAGGSAGEAARGSRPRCSSACRSAGCASIVAQLKRFANQLFYQPLEWLKVFQVTQIMISVG